MFQPNCVNASYVNNPCRGCLKIGHDVRTMTSVEQTLYLRFLQVSNDDISMSVCMLCAHLLKKFGKFLFQCQEAYNILNNSLFEETKRIYISQLTFNLATSQPQISEFRNDSYDFTSELVQFEDVLDDEDVPLVLLKSEGLDIKDDLYIEEGLDIKDDLDIDDGLNIHEALDIKAGLDIEDGVKKRKSKKKPVDVKETDTVIKKEELKSKSSEKENEKIKCKKKPKKELREGFSSRMVQETEEYVVIKLTKEQVIQEMNERSKRAEYTRALYKCVRCVKGFNFEDVLRTHMEKHSTENGSLQCDICTQYCPSVVSLRGHMKSHTTRYKCKVCGCVRQARQHLLEHHTSHTGARAYTCRHCDFNTSKRTTMQRHVKTHNAGERHACHQCGKLFKSEETLRVHTIRHDKSKRLQCEECSRMFIYPSLLHRHMQAVHVRKDYYCVECDVEFKSRENLRLHFKKAKRHRDSSSYQYECTQCHERFVSPSTLSTHVAAAHGDQKQHSCADCQRAYSSRDALRAHTRAKHSSTRIHCGACDRSFTKLAESMLTENPPLLES